MGCSVFLTPHNWMEAAPPIIAASIFAHILACPGTIAAWNASAATPGNKPWLHATGKHFCLLRLRGQRKSRQAHHGTRLLSHLTFSILPRLKSGSLISSFSRKSSFSGDVYTIVLKVSIKIVQSEEILSRLFFTEASSPSNPIASAIGHQLQRSHPR